MDRLRRRRGEGPADHDAARLTRGPMTESRWRRYRRFWHSTVQDQVDDEVDFHFQMRVEQFMASGMSRDDAEREARERFGDVAVVRSTLIDIDSRTRRYRDWRDRFDGVRQDVVIAMRALRREPLFTAGVVLTLALGIGANATMFGVIDRLMLRGPEHVVDAGHINRLYITSEKGANGPVSRSGLGYVTYAALRKHAQSLAAVAAYSVGDSRSYGVGDRARTIPVTSATWDLFPLLGVRPVAGRFFDQTEDHPPRGVNVAVISEEFWRSELGGERSAIGQRLALGDESFTIIGVAPRGFTGPERVATDVWLPASLTTIRADWPTTYQAQWLKIIGRLKPDVDARRAGAEATAILRAAYDGPDPPMHQLVASFRPLWYGPRGEPSPVANVSRWLMGVAVTVLLITCANVANLMVARSRRRRREVAVRVALGASRARLLRFVLTETMVLALAGGTMALLVAYVGDRFMHATLLSSVAWDGSAVDPRVLMFTLGIAVAVGLAVGLAPAIEASRLSLTNSLKNGGGDGGGRRARVRAALSIAQATLCVVLLIGAGLFVESLARSHGVNLGFQPDRVLRASLDFSLRGLDGSARDKEKARQSQVLLDVVERLRHQPWVEHAAIAVGSPYGNAFGVGLKVPGRDSIPQLAGGSYVSAVTSDYFATVGTPVIRGRTFTPADRDGSALVVIVNETMAKSLWPGEDALGKCVIIGDDAVACSQVVGVAGDVHLNSLREPASMQYYVPFGQERGFGGSVIVVRPRGVASDAFPLLRNAFVAVGGLPHAKIETIQQKIDPEFRPWRLGAAMFGIFGALALVIAAVGLYSVIAYLVADRTREIGVRIALGASRARIIREVVLTGITTTAIGVVTGIAVALATGRYLEPLLFDESVRDPRVLVIVAALVLAIAVVAAWSPARRASRVDPAIALRAD